MRFRNNMSMRFHTTILCVFECEKNMRFALSQHVRYNNARYWYFHGFVAVRNIIMPLQVLIQAVTSTLIQRSLETTFAEADLNTLLNINPRSHSSSLNTGSERRRNGHLTQMRGTLSATTTYSCHVGKLHRVGRRLLDGLVNSIRQGRIQRLFARQAYWTIWANWGTAGGGTVRACSSGSTRFSHGLWQNKAQLLSWRRG